MTPSRPSHRALVLLTLLATPLAAQSEEWKIPDPGAAIYTRTQERKIESTAKADGRKQPQLPGLPRQAPTQHVLFRSDLDEKARSPVRMPESIPDLVPWLAFDMRTARGRKKVKEVLEPMKPYGFLLVEGDIERPDRDTGVQRIELQVLRVDPPRSYGRLPRGQENQYRTGIDVTISIERVVDEDAGIVRSITSTIAGTLTNPEGDPFPTVQVEVRDTWTFDRFQERGSEFNAQVADAILRGREFVLKAVEKKLGKGLGAPPERGKNHAVDHNGGELALQLLTLIKAGYRPDHEVVKRGLDEVRRRKFHDTYSLGVALMLLEAVYANPNERQHLLDGLIDKPQPRVPSDEDRAIMQEWVDTLLENRDDRPDPAYLCRWTYNGGPAFDNSNTQYALLGLWSAKLCGIEIPTQTWWAAANHWIDSQCKEEGKHPLRTVTHRALANGAERPRTASLVPAAGWSYRGGNEAAYGSMTTAGIAGLTICAAALREDGVRGGKLGDYLNAVRQGHAWLAQNFSVHENPNRGNSWAHYYLYGLERACELSQVAWLDDHDWYFEGATLLMESQAENGSFQGAREPEQCFAVLFLKKVSLPVFTGDR